MDISSIFKTLVGHFESKLGFAGVLLAFTLMIIFFLIRKIISDKDEQIKRLSDENNTYKDRFIQILDKRLDVNLVAPQNQN